jgi:hypothetical protein
MSIKETNQLFRKKKMTIENQFYVGNNQIIKCNSYIGEKRNYLEEKVQSSNRAKISFNLQKVKVKILTYLLIN